MCKQKKCHHSCCPCVSIVVLLFFCFIFCSPSHYVSLTRCFKLNEIINLKANNTRMRPEKYLWKLALCPVRYLFSRINSLDLFHVCCNETDWDVEENDVIKQLRKACWRLRVARRKICLLVFWRSILINVSGDKDSNDFICLDIASRDKLLNCWSFRKSFIDRIARLNVLNDQRGAMKWKLFTLHASHSNSRSAAKQMHLLRA